MLRGYRYRIYPNEVQRSLIEQTFGCCRLVYNTALDAKIYAYKSQGISLSFFDLCKQLTDMKQDYDWMYLVSNRALQSAIRNMDSAWLKFFSGGGYPKVRSKKGGQSFQIPPVTQNKIDFKNNLLTISKLKDIKIRIDRRFDGERKTVTISKSPSGKYYASILVEDGLQVPKKKTVKKSVGIDVGIKTLSVLSDGTSFENPKFLRNAIERLKVLQKHASRKKKGSANQKKAYKKVAVQHEKIANQRRDFSHKMTTLIAKKYDTICVEDLRIKNMSRRAKPKQDDAGNYVKNGAAAKSGLNRSILDAGWGEILRQLEYKSEWAGNNFVRIPTFAPSSKTCSCCGAINENLTLAQREWTCETCGSEHDRDKNASTNIERIGVEIILEKTRRGTSVEPVELRTKVRAVKQEVRKNGLP